MTGKNKSRKLLALAAALAMLTLGTVPVSAASEVSKEETVYVVTEADGSQSEITVSDELLNSGEMDKIHDRSNLKDIENVKGDETFETGEGDELTWNAEGNDIFYQGTTDKEVPVQLGISYFLNGKEVSGSDMEGASGEVKIIINYRNTAKDDKGTTVPFLALTAFIAEDESFTDISIDHGKVIDDGDKKVVAAIAVPGISEALDIDPDLLNIDLEDTVTITGTAKDFNIQDMMTVVTNSIFDEVDADDIGDLDYDDQIRELDKGARALMDGSKQLYQGIDLLYDNMPALEDGVDQLKEGADKLKKGTDSALSGSKKLNSGAEKLRGSLISQMTDLTTGTGQLYAGSDSVLQGMKQLKKGLDGSGTESDPGAIGGLGQVNKGLGQVEEGLGSAVDGINEVNGSLTAVTPASYDVYQYLLELNGALSKLSDKEKQKLTARVGSDLVNDLGKATKEAATVYGTLDAVAGSGSDQPLNKIGSGVSSAKDGISAASSGVGQVKEGLEKASGSLGSYDPEAGQQQTTLIGGMTVIKNGLGNMYETLSQATGKDGELTTGLDSLVSGTQSLANGEVKLAGGSKELAKGMGKLQDNSATLSGGVSKLDKGSLTLSKGMSELYKKGIRKIVDLYNDDLKGNLNSIEDVMDAGQSYTTFTELGKGMDGSVKFIYKTTIY